MPGRPPDWLLELANAIAMRLHPTDLLAPLACHYHFNRKEQQWEVTLFAGDTHIIGGQFDGQRNRSNFVVDLRSVMEAFEKVLQVGWQANPLGSDDQLGSHVSIEGVYRQQEIWLRILAAAPPGFEHGREAVVYESRIEEVW